MDDLQAINNARIGVVNSAREFLRNPGAPGALAELQQNLDVHDRVPGANVGQWIAAADLQAWLMSQANEQSFDDLSFGAGVVDAYLRVGRQFSALTAADVTQLISIMEGEG